MSAGWLARGVPAVGVAEWVGSIAVIVGPLGW